MFDISK